MPKRLAPVAVLLACVLFGGCSAGFRAVAVDPIPPSQPFEYTSVVVSARSLMVDQTDEEMSDLKVAIVDQLEKLSGMPPITLEHEGSNHANALLIEVVVDDLRKVSGEQRFWLGSMAGRANMSASINFRNGDSEEALGQYRVTGESGGSGFSGGTSDAVLKTAQGIKEIMMKAFGLQESKGR